MTLITGSLGLFTALVVATILSLALFRLHNYQRHRERTRDNRHWLAGVIASSSADDPRCPECQLPLQICIGRALIGDGPIHTLPPENAR